MLRRQVCTGATAGRIACLCKRNLAWLVLVLAAFPVIGADATIWRGIRVADEHRCSTYDRSNYRYPASTEAEIIKSQTGTVYGPYTGRTFESPKQTDIEHIVALSEAHDSGLCAATPAVRRQFAADLLNLTLAAPEVNRCSVNAKCAKDAAEWMPQVNRCWFVDRVIRVRRKYDLSIDTREARAIDQVIEGCDSFDLVILEGEVVPGTTRRPEVPASVEQGADALALWDDNRNGRITCKEAHRHGIAPVAGGHPAYRFMRDGDNDGVVCE